MGSFVDSLQICGAHVGIDLRRRETLVTEQLLDAANVGSVVEQVRGETMSQRVRCCADIESADFQMFL